MQAVAVFLYDSGLIWLLLLFGGSLLRSFFLALGAYVALLAIGWLTVGDSLAVGLPMLIVGAVLVYFGVRTRARLTYAAFQARN